MDYLKGITVGKKIFAPKNRTINSPEHYFLTLIRKDGSQQVLTLDDNLGYAGKHYTVVKPKSWDLLHELIAGSPAWWQE